MSSTTSWPAAGRTVQACLAPPAENSLPAAPLQVVIVPIVKKPEEKEAVDAAAGSIFAALKAAGIRVKLDDNDRQVCCVAAHMHVPNALLHLQ